MARCGHRTLTSHVSMAPAAIIMATAAGRAKDKQRLQHAVSMQQRGTTGTSGVLSATSVSPASRMADCTLDDKESSLGVIVCETAFHVAAAGAG